MNDELDNSPVTGTRSDYSQRQIAGLLVAIHALLPDAVSIRNDPLLHGHMIKVHNRVKVFIERKDKQSFDFTTPAEVSKTKEELIAHLQKTTGLNGEECLELIRLCKQIEAFNRMGAWPLYLTRVPKIEADERAIDGRPLEDDDLLVEVIEDLQEFLPTASRLDFHYQRSVAPRRAHGWVSIVGEGPNGERECAALDIGFSGLHLRSEIVRPTVPMLYINRFRIRVWADQFGCQVPDVLRVLHHLVLLSSHLNLTSVRLR